jgi:uncharacterized Fe-S cluster protein YjdI
MGKHKYSNEKISVEWDSKICIHAAECVKNLGEVFNPDEKPWINVEAASPDRIAEAIKLCPSGALTYQKAGDQSDSERKAEDEIKIVVGTNGPFRVSGNVVLEDADGNRIETRERFSLCRCGASENKPFCDGSHKRIGFEG